MRAHSTSWNLAADAGMLLYLKRFSQRIIARTHDIGQLVYLQAYIHLQNQEYVFMCSCLYFSVFPQSNSSRLYLFISLTLFIYSFLSSLFSILFSLPSPPPPPLPNTHTFTCQLPPPPDTPCFRWIIWRTMPSRWTRGCTIPSMNFKCLQTRSSWKTGFLMRRQRLTSRPRQSPRKRRRSRRRRESNARQRLCPSSSRRWR